MSNYDILCVCDLVTLWHVVGFLKYSWQEFVFVGQSGRAAKSVWEVGATEADWELRAPTSHLLSPAISSCVCLQALFGKCSKVKAENSFFNSKRGADPSFSCVLGFN